MMATHEHAPSIDESGMRSARSGPGALSGKVAVVVGGGQQPGETMGNGRAAAVAFAAAGARVMVVDRIADRAEATSDEIRAAGGESVAIAADITEAASCDRIVLAALEAFGRVDVLHNNVGVVIADPIEATEVDEWRRGLDINLTGAWTTCRAFLPTFRAQGSGVILNISSLASLVASATAYSVAKAGLNSLTEGLALEYAPHGIRVNAILPGLIDTPIGSERTASGNHAERAALASARAAQVPLGRQGTAEDIAAAAVFLASDAASYITGAILPVDGGIRLRMGGVSA